MTRLEAGNVVSQPSIQPLHALAINVLRTLENLGGSARIAKLARTRSERRTIRAAVHLAAREGLLRSHDGETYTLTEKARTALETARDTKVA
jgi:repressor of nif and glnA expression